MTHCRQKASRCILIRQRRGLQLIDITVILFWSTFFLFPLRCTVACVCIGGLWLSPSLPLHKEEKEDTGGTYRSGLRRRNSPQTLLELTVFNFCLSPFVVIIFFVQFYPWTICAVSFGKLYICNHLTSLLFFRCLLLVSKSYLATIPMHADATASSSSSKER